MDFYEVQIVDIIKSSKNKDDEIDEVGKEKIKEYFTKALDMLELLRTKYDLIREKYWLYIINKMKSKYESYIN